VTVEPHKTSVDDDLKSGAKKVQVSMLHSMSSSKLEFVSLQSMFSQCVKPS
jgi:hypothetical protein